MKGTDENETSFLRNKWLWHIEHPFVKRGFHIELELNEDIPGDLNIYIQEIPEIKFWQRKKRKLFFQAIEEAKRMLPMGIYLKYKTTVEIIF